MAALNCAKSFERYSSLKNYQMSLIMLTSGIDHYLTPKILNPSNTQSCLVHLIRLRKFSYAMSPLGLVTHYPKERFSSDNTIKVWYFSIRPLDTYTIIKLKGKITKRDLTNKMEQQTAWGTFRNSKGLDGLKKTKQALSHGWTHWDWS